MSSPFIPGWKNGYATGGASMAPGLWKQIRGLWVPSMGPTGLTLRDVSGWGRHGTNVGTTWVAGENGWSIIYGAGDYSQTSLNVNGLFNWSWSAWVKPVETANKNGLFSDWNADPFGILIRFDGSDLQAFIDTAGGGAEGGALGVSPSTGVWQLFSVVRNGATVTGYKNGVAGASPLTLDSGAITSGADIRIGFRNTSADDLNATLSNTIFWDRALATSEIQQLHARPNDMLTPRPTQVAVSGAAAGGPFPWYTGRNLSGNMQGLTGGIGA